VDLYGQASEEIVVEPEEPSVSPEEPPVICPDFGEGALYFYTLLDLWPC